MSRATSPTEAITEANLALAFKRYCDRLESMGYTPDRSKISMATFRDSLAETRRSSHATATATEMSAAGAGGGPRLFQASPTTATSTAIPPATNRERLACIKTQLAELETQFSSFAKAAPHPVEADEAIAIIAKLKASISKFEEKALYQCRLMNELLNKGLMLPSGNTVDESSLVAHLRETITGKKDPFTNMSWDLNLANYKSKAPENRDTNTAIDGKLTKFEKQLRQLNTVLSEVNLSPIAAAVPASR